jgi:hypothetical protein
MKKGLFIFCLSLSVFCVFAQQSVTCTLDLPVDPCRSTVYVNVEMEAAINIYPNPVVDELNVPLLAFGEKADVLLLDANGKLLQLKSVPEDESLCRFSLTGYPAGIYFVQVVTGKKVTYKVIKE